jgi:predicted transposase YbfD/YdcC
LPTPELNIIKLAKNYISEDAFRCSHKIKRMDRKTLSVGPPD